MTIIKGKLEDIIRMLYILDKDFKDLPNEIIKSTITLIYNKLWWCYENYHKEIFEDGSLIEDMFKDFSSIYQSCWYFSPKNFSNHLPKLRTEIYQFLQSYKNDISLPDLITPEKGFLTVSEIKEMMNIEPSSQDILTREEAIDKKPDLCEKCSSTRLDLFVETDEEVVFKCQNCGRNHGIPFDPTTHTFYL